MFFFSAKSNVSVTCVEKGVNIRPKGEQDFFGYPHALPDLLILFRFSFDAAPFEGTLVPTIGVHGRSCLPRSESSSAAHGTRSAGSCFFSHRRWLGLPGRFGTGPSGRVVAMLLQTRLALFPRSGASASVATASR